MGMFDDIPSAGETATENRPRSPTRIEVRPLDAYADAIAKTESGGNYRAIGPATRTGDRAFGKYQVMGENIGPWTQEALGRPMTRQEFLLSPEAQDAVFQAKFGSYVDKYGPERAAQAWFAGEGGMNDPNRRDVLGTSVADYGRKFAANMGPTDVSAQSRQPANASAPTHVGFAPDSAPTPPSAGGMFDDIQVAEKPREQQGPPVPDMGRLNAGLAGAKAGFTLNLGDEISGLRAAGEGVLPGFVRDAAPATEFVARPLIGAARLGLEYLTGQGQGSQAYEQARDASRQELATARQQYPGTTTAAEVAGSLATPIPGAVAARGASGLARAARTGGVGAVTGAIAGAGEGEGLEDRATRAAIGGAVGLVGGAAASPVVDLAARGIGTAAREAGRYLLPNVEARAASAIQGAIRASERTDPRAVGRLTPAEVAGNPAATVADMGGEQGRALARWASNASPEARDVLSQMTNDRYEGQAGRVVAWLNRMFHYPNAGAQQEALEAARRQANNVNYQRAMQEGSGGLWSPELERLAGSDTVSVAMQRASAAAKDEAIVGGGGAFNPRVTFTPDGRMQIARGPTGAPTYPDLQYWDLVRREVSDSAQAAQRAGRATEARRLNSFAAALNAELDRLVPSYQQARNTAASFFGARDALEAGQNFVRQNFRNEEVRAQFARMSPTERQLFQDGFVSRFIESLGATGDRRNVLNQIAASPQAREKLNIVLGPQRANELEAMLRVEGVMQMTRVAQQGNSTTARQLIELGVITPGAGGISAYYSQDPSSIAQSALVGAFALRGRNTDRRVAEQVARMLTSRDPAVFTRGLQVAARNQRLMDSIRSLDQRLARIGGAEGSGVPALQSMGTGRAEGDNPNVPGP